MGSPELPNLKYGLAIDAPDCMNRQVAPLSPKEFYEFPDLATAEMESLSAQLAALGETEAAEYHIEEGEQ